MDGGSTMIIKKDLKIGMIMLLLAFLMISRVSAFGVAGYPDPVKVRPGESINLALELQNMGGEGEDYFVESTLSAQEGIKVELLDNVTVYDLPAGTRERVNFRVMIPENVKIGNNYTVRGVFYANQKSSNQANPLGVKTGMAYNIIIQIADITDDTNKITPTPVPNTEIPKSSNMGRIITLIALILIAIVVYFYVQRKNNPKNGTSKKE